MDSMAEKEITHGEKLSTMDTELVWGWGTPAGKQRAKRRAGMIIEAAGLNPRSHVLEIGCGTGLFTEFFARSGARIDAVDISEKLLNKAIERRLSPSQVQFRCVRFEELDSEVSYDAIIGSSVLHHLDVEISCKKIFTMLKAGGKMCFTEPNMLNPQIFIERHFRRWFPQVSPDETAFFRWKLRKTLLRIGFEPISVFPFDWLHPAIPDGWIKTVGKLGGLFEKIPFIKEFSGSLLIKAWKPLK